MSYISNFRVADATDLVSRAEYTLQFQSEKLHIEQFPQNKKIPLDDSEHTWITASGRITGLATKYFSYVLPFWQTVETRLEPEYEEVSESVPLTATSQRVVSPFNFTSENGTFFFYEGHRKIRSPGIPEEALVTSLCGGPQPHLGIGIHHLNSISAEGVPDLLIGIKQKGEHADLIHKNFLARGLARLIGFDDRERLVAFGHIHAAGLLDEHTTFNTPAKPIITARRIDTTFYALVAAGSFATIAATFQSSPGGRSLIGAIVMAGALAKAYSRYYR